MVVVPDDPLGMFSDDGLEVMVKSGAITMTLTIVLRDVVVFEPVAVRL